MAKILIIDDDEQVRGMLHQLLTSAGHAVTTAHDGASGFKRHRADPADLVITDIVMPDQEGLETITKLRRAYPDLPIIAMSGSHGQEELWLKIARLLGAKSTLPKPFTIAQLTDAVTLTLSDSRKGFLPTMQEGCDSASRRPLPA